MKPLIAILLLALALPVSALDRYTATITVTNNPATGDTLYFSAPVALTLTFTNATGATTVATNATAEGAATNLRLYFSSYAVGSPRLAVEMVDSNIVRLLGENGQALSVGQTGNWCDISYSTQVVARLIPVHVPLASEYYASNRIKIANGMVQGISDYAATTFATNAAALANFLTLGAAPTQTITAPIRINILAGATNTGTIYGGTNDGVRIFSGSINGAIGNLTNGVITNVSLLAPIVRSGSFFSPSITNAAIYGSILQIEGSVPNVIAQAKSTTPAFCGFLLMQRGSLLSGAVTNAEADMQLGILGWQGYGDTVWKNPARIAVYADERITDSVCGARMGFYVASVGASVYDEKMRLNGFGLSVSNNLSAGTITNAVLTGTAFSSGLRMDSVQTVTTLVNSNNVFPAITGTICEITTGPTAAFNICAIPAGTNGQHAILVNLNGNDMLFDHESGFDSTAENRVLTMSGATRATTGNGAARLYYSGSQSRWILLSLEQ